MVDYIKISIIGVDIERLSNLPELEFIGTFSESTGVLNERRTAEYHFCKITIFENGSVQFSGSIHKLWNSLKGILAPNYVNNESYRGFNGNLFQYQNIIEVKEHLSSLFNCSCDQMTIENIEFGFNTTLSFNPQLFLKGLLFHKGKYFEFRHKEHFAQVVHQRYYLKIYNKSNQYKMKDHTLRVELKYRKTQDIKQFGISTISDLNESTLKLASKMVLNRFIEVVYYDYTIQKEKLSSRQNKILSNYSNPRYWLNDLPSNKRDTPKKKLKQIIEKYSNNLHGKISQEIKQKASAVFCFSSADKWVMINRTFDKDSSAKKAVIKTKKVQPIKKTSWVIINRSSIGLIITHSPPQQPQGYEALKRGIKTSYSEKVFLIEKTEVKNERKKSIENDTCKHCQKEIIARRKDSIYCSKKCNNKHNGMRKAKLNRERIKEEKKNVARLIKTIPKTDYWLNVSYREKGNIYTDFLHQTEIHTSTDWINKVSRIELEIESQRIELNGMQAKQYIRKLNTFNLGDESLSEKPKFAKS